MLDQFRPEKIGPFYYAAQQTTYGRSIILYYKIVLLILPIAGSFNGAITLQVTC